MKPFLVTAVVAIVLIGGSTEAQVLEPPQRAAQLPPVTPDRPRVHQNVVVGLDFLGGFDDNLRPQGGDSAADFTPRPSGYSGFSDANLSYFIGHNLRSLEVGGRSYVTSYQNIGLRPTYGGSMNARVQTTVGRRGRLEFRPSFHYDPFFSFGAFGLLQDSGSGNLTDANPLNGLVESPSQVIDTSISFSEELSQHNRLGLDYTFNKHTYLRGANFDSQGHVGSISYDHSLGRSVGLRASYRRSDMTTILHDGQSRPFQDDTLDAGMSYSRNLSRTRRVSFSAGGGATHASTINDATALPLDYWVPSGYATARFDFGRSWSTAANYRRGVTVMQGITPQSFVTDAADGTIGGLLAPRLEGTFNAAFSDGIAGYDQNLIPGEVRNYTYSVQLRFEIARWVSALTTYRRYQYHLNSSAALNLGMLPRQDRNAVMVGFALSFPVVGPYPDQPGSTIGRGN